jgi:hypothetical protein
VETNQAAADAFAANVLLIVKQVQGQPIPVSDVKGGCPLVGLHRQTVYTTLIGVEPLDDLDGDVGRLSGFGLGRDEDRRFAAQVTFVCWPSPGWPRSFLHREENP